MLRLVVLPLAQQRETRRRQPASALSMLPAETTDFVLRRNSFRRLSPRLWPEGESLPIERAADWGLPVDSLQRESSLGLFTGGEWLAAFDGERAWIFGPLKRLTTRRPEAAHLGESDQARWDCAGLQWAGRGYFFVAAEDEAALAAADGTWLAGLPAWSELGDLLVGGDLLAFHREGPRAALLSAKRLDEAILLEILAWGTGDLEDLVSEAFPLPDPVGKGPIPEELPFLRSTPPWDGQGAAMEPAGEAFSREGERLSALRLWKGENCLVRLQLLSFEAKD